MDNPYSSLPAHAFWRSAVAEPEPSDIAGLWQPKFKILPKHKVSTYGSCFAQHIGRALKARGYNWHCTEVAPRDVPEALAREFNYGIFSSRTANIYTTTLLLQWARWAFEGVPVPDEVWEEDGRFIDPFRPRIEPGGFESREELLRMRAVVLEAFRRSVTEADFFVFTLGLTERWINRAEGYEYPMCPGTAGGVFDADLHGFENLHYGEVRAALRKAMRIFRAANPKLRFILTVSPVPLTATASGGHVLTATTHSKSVLRAVAGEMAMDRRHTDYFPSYEIITSPVYRGAFFEENLRSVRPDGVDYVMSCFFRDLAARFGGASDTPTPVRQIEDEPEVSADDIVCEEELLAAFGKRDV